MSSPNTLELTALRALLSAGGDKQRVTAPQVVAAAAAAGVTLNAPTVYRILTRLRDLASRRTVDGVRRFILTEHGCQLLAGGTVSSNSATFVKPGTPWSTQNDLRDFLEHASAGFLLVIDPYIAEETLDILAKVKTPIRILSHQLGRRGREADFLRAYRRFAKQHGQIELREISRTELHGRYLFTDGQGWVVDHSLQDLGTKPALILPLHLEVVFDDVHRHFETVFNSGTVIS